MTPADVLSMETIETAIQALRNYPAMCEKSLRIRDEAGSLVPMIPRPGPTVLHDAIQRQREAGVPVRIVALKARRTNFTAAACAEIFIECAMRWPGRKATIIADHYKPAAVEAFGYLQGFQEHYEPYPAGETFLELPKLVSDTQHKLEYANDSMIEVLSAERGEIRGGGRHCLLLDEFGFWRDAKKSMVGALNMVPRIPESMVIVQSTANGIGNEFYNMVQKAMDPRNESGWLFVFFGWLQHPLNRIPLGLEAQAKLLQTLDKDEKTLVAMHGATLEQVAWRRWKISTELGGDLEMFKQEYPTTPEEAFLATGRPALNHRAISRMPVTEPITGEIEEIDDFPKKRVAYRAAEFGRLCVWKMPEEGHRYGAGMDPSHGKDADDLKRGSDPDYAVLLIGDLDTGEQVAMLRDRMRPGPFAEYGALVMKWYNFAYCVPEANDPGFIDALAKAYPPALLYNRRRDPTDKHQTDLNEIGFLTTSENRHWLVQAIDEAITKQAIIIHSSIMVQECYTFVYKPNGKAEHQRGCHDDTVIAGAFFCMARRYAPRVLRAMTQDRGPMDNRRNPMRSLGSRLRRDEED